MGDIEEKAMTDSERAWLRLKCFELILRDEPHRQLATEKAEELFK